MGDGGEEFEAESHDTDAGHSAAKKLQSAIEKGELTIFDRREAAALQSMARLWLAFESMGKVATWFKNALVIVGFFILTYLSFRDAIYNWLHGVTK